MGKRYRIAYGYKRSEREFVDLDIYEGKFYIDNVGTDRQELRDVIALADENFTVVVIKLSDFGPGAKARQIVNILEGNGAEIEGPKQRPEVEIVDNRGRPSKGEMSPEDYRWARSLWLDPSRVKSVVLGRIQERTGIDFSRDQMNYLFIRKPKLDAAKKKKKR